MKKMLSALMVMSCFIACKAQTAYDFKIHDDENTLLWKISGAGLSKPSFLFGTFHLLCKEDVRLSDQLEQAVKISDDVYMELDMDDPSTLMSGMFFMNMKDEKKLKDFYTPGEYERLTTYFKDTLQMPIMLLERAKPYFLVALMYPRMMSCAAPVGVEQELLKIAKDNQKEVIGLETVESQASVFDSIPYDWQAKELLKNIDSFSVYKKEFENMVNLYRNQNLDSMQRLMMESDFGTGKYEELLLTKRNKNWVKQLDQIMKERGVFVAVGAGHLTGDDGVINLLRKANYKVEPLTN